MRHLKAKLLIAGLILAAAVGYLTYAGVRSGKEYYIKVDEFLGKPEYQQRRVRLVGRASEDLVIAADRSGADFQLLGEKGTKVRVSYRGSIPDLFKPGCDCVLQGKLESDGVFHADQLLTKCASKSAPGGSTERGGPS